MEDIRSTEPNEDGYRRARFHVGWQDAIDQQEYQVETLDNLTWQNLGWRLGDLLGETDTELIDEFYDLAVKQQRSA